MSLVTGSLSATIDDYYALCLFILGESFIETVALW